MPNQAPRRRTFGDTECPEASKHRKEQSATRCNCRATASESPLSAITRRPASPNNRTRANPHWDKSMRASAYWATAPETRPGKAASSGDTPFNPAPAGPKTERAAPITKPSPAKMDPSGGDARWVLNTQRASSTTGPLPRMVCTNVLKSYNPEINPLLPVRWRVPAAEQGGNVNETGCPAGVAAAIVIGGKHTCILRLGHSSDMTFLINVVNTTESDHCCQWLNTVASAGAAAGTSSPSDHTEPSLQRSSSQDTETSDSSSSGSSVGVCPTCGRSMAGAATPGSRTVAESVVSQLRTRRASFMQQKADAAIVPRQSLFGLGSEGLGTNLDYLDAEIEQSVEAKRGMVRTVREAIQADRIQALEARNAELRQLVALASDALVIQLEGMSKADTK
mmetsp:Transcript_100295/g.230304  ORF Transcript_100295/g.230304 Transcript_100295/m.230304 type:complete len:393 (-) Transcript_100295:162-1340(-)